MADVIVIGGGGSGLAAAVEAGSDGARVVVLEKNTQLGGTTGIAVGSLTAACTSFQAAAGIQDSPSEHDEDMAKFAAEREQFNNAPLRRLLAEQAAETLEWLMGLGVEFVGPNPEPPNRVPRMHNVVPNAKAYIAALHRAALRYGVEIRVGCAAKRLIQDAQGRVVGMEAEDDAGRSLTFQATKGVVLAAGDYSNGYDIKRQFLPESIASIEGINPLCTGDGHRMGMEVGAALANMHLVFGPQIRFVQPPKPPFAQMLPTSPVLAKIMARTYDLLPRAVTRHIMKSLLVTWQHPEDTLFQKGAILVNREGRRFVDELSQPELAIPQQPGKEAFVLMDNRVAQVFSAFPNFISTAPDIAYAYLDDYRRLRQDITHEAPTLDGLASCLNMDAATLRQTVADHSSAARGERPDAFGRKTFCPPLVEPPFIALGPARSWIVTAEGGLKVDLEMRVLNQRGEPMPGLYAAGNNGIGGAVLWGHGLHIAWAFLSGRLAGRSAAGAS